MVREEGIEPSNPYGYRILSPVRLPISPLPRIGADSTCCRNIAATARRSSAAFTSTRVTVFNRWLSLVQHRTYNSPAALNKGM